MKEIYLTTFDESDPNKVILQPSTSSGFATLDAVVAAIGAEYLTRSPRLIVYPGGVAFSDYRFTK